MDVDIHIVLYQPVIPQNTGSIARLCACTGVTLHLIHPLGFLTDERSVRRAGLDYWPFVKVKEHASWEAFLESENPQALRLFTKKGRVPFWKASYPQPCYLVLGSETKGLPDEILSRYAEQVYQVPMRTHIVRSLNLSQCAAVALYEALRQNEISFDKQEDPTTRL